MKTILENLTFKSLVQLFLYISSTNSLTDFLIKYIFIPTKIRYLIAHRRYTSASKSQLWVWRKWLFGTGVSVQEPHMLAACQTATGYLKFMSFFSKNLTIQPPNKFACQTYGGRTFSHCLLLAVLTLLYTVHFCAYVEYIGLKYSDSFFSWPESQKFFRRFLEEDTHTEDTQSIYPRQEQQRAVTYFYWYSL